MKKEISVKKNERGFGYIELVSGAHDHIKTRVWVHGSIACEETIEFPVQNARVHSTEKGGYVLRPDTNSTVYWVSIPSGYRGDAGVERVENGEIVCGGKEFHSGQGSLGLTAWVVINGEKYINVYGHRSGRRVDDENVSIRYYKDGEEEQLIIDSEVCELLK